MKTSKLIELYGRRLTPSAKLIGFIALLLFGILIAFTANDNNLVNQEMKIEQTLEE